MILLNITVPENFWQIVGLASIITAIISSLFNFYFNRRLKQIDFEFDYKKFILKKRQDAYTEVENLLRTLGKKIRSEKSLKQYHHIFKYTSNLEPVSDFIGHIINVISNQTFWLTPSLAEKLTDLKIILEAIKTEIKGTYPESNHEELGIKNFGIIENKRSEICRIYFSDIKELDNVKKFKKEKISF
jgi:hypothetical protein